MVFGKKIKILIQVLVPVPVLLGWLEPNCISFKIWRILEIFFFFFCSIKKPLHRLKSHLAKLSQKKFKILLKFFFEKKSHCSQGQHLNPSSNFKPTTV